MREKRERDRERDNVCVCVWERARMNESETGQRQRNREEEKWKLKERVSWKNVCLLIRPGISHMGILHSTLVSDAVSFSFVM